MQFILDRTYILCSNIRRHKGNKYDYILHTTLIIHGKTATCFGYTYLAIIRQDIGP
jgi:hypothetical protein